MIDEFESNIVLAITLLSSVFPTPVGPKNKKLAIGLLGSLSPVLDLLIESENVSEAFFLARRLVASGEDWANSYLDICRSMM